MSRAAPSNPANYVRGHGDPRLKVLWYLGWYCVVWSESFWVLLSLFAVQFALSVAMRIFRGSAGKAILLIVYVALVLTAISVWVGNETYTELVSIWCKWGVVVLATFNAAAGMELQELFAALNMFRIPRSIVFTLGIAVRTIPLIIDEVRRVSFARLAWGHRSAVGLRRISDAVRTLRETLIPVLLGILNRAEKMWFTIELRGLRNRLYRPAPGQRDPVVDAIIIASGFLPVVGVLVSRFG